MKVLLVQPNRVYAKAVWENTPSISVPLGLLWIAATLEEQGVEVDLFDCLNRPETRIESTAQGCFLGVELEHLAERLRRYQPEIVGVGCQFTAQWASASEAIRLVRATLPGCVIVAGGPHATVSGREILQAHPEVDYVLAGEGERSMPQLVRLLAEGATPASVPGLLWREASGEVRANPIALIEDLDSLPLPAYHLFDFERYFALQQQGVYARGRRERSVSLITSRGCPFTCVFCSIHITMGRRVRAHSADYTIGHMRLLMERYGVRNFQIEDDNFTFHRERVLEICRRMIAERFAVTWETPNGVRADLLTDEMLAVMKASGCAELAIAAESGDQQVLDRIVKKRLKLEQIERAAELARKHGIRLGCFFVIGFPGESRANIQTTLDFALRLFRKYECRPMINAATPLPGTELMETAVAGGYLIGDLGARDLEQALANPGRGLIRTEAFDPEYLAERKEWLHGRLRRVRLLHMFWRPALLMEAISNRLARRRR